MGVTDKLPADDQDYRSSHLERGSRYDANLAESPFDAYMSGWERKLLPQVIRQHFPGGVQRYLDFACGTGRITEQVVPFAKQSVAVDISPSMIEEARKKCPQTTFHLADLTTQNPDLGGSFDLVSSFRFFGNAQDELREGALRAITQRMAPGGHLLINSHRNPRALYALFDRLTGGNTGSMDLHLPKLRALLDRHGLSIVSMRPIGAWMYRTSLMLTTKVDDARAVRNEARFSGEMFASIAPDLILVARKR
ncbi:MAG: class I SAM-dependent methyltransferase [Rubrivivax sp.]|nr:class I SAM-dependent methyltransferase [Rubrivivax sp.]MDP3611483.1 class I SAM-dependent methyltransferase [Rubrivivax sp.]